MWEAVYFDHDFGKLTALADRAASVGVERTVLDDGWFLGRRSDRPAWATGGSAKPSGPAGCTGSPAMCAGCWMSRPAGPSPRKPDVPE